MISDEEFEARLRGLFVRPGGGRPTPQCLTDEQWQLLLETEGQDEVCERLREHIANCAYCQSEEIALQAAFEYAKRNQAALESRTLALLERERLTERIWEIVRAPLYRLREELQIALTAEGPQLAFAATRPTVTRGVARDAMRGREAAQPTTIPLPAEDLTLQVSTRPVREGAAAVAVRMTTVNRSEVDWSVAAFPRPREPEAQPLAQAEGLTLDRVFTWVAPSVGSYELTVGFEGETYVLPLEVREQGAST